MLRFDRLVCGFVRQSGNDSIIQIEIKELLYYEFRILSLYCMVGKTVTTNQMNCHPEKNLLNDSKLTRREDWPALLLDVIVYARI